LSKNIGYFQNTRVKRSTVAAIHAHSEGNYVFIWTKTGSDNKSLAYECLPLVRASRLVHLTLTASNQIA